jgi:hypothetical protein
MRSRLAGCLVWVLACLPQALFAAPPPGLPVITVRLLAGTDPSILHDLEYVRPARGAEPVTLQLDLAHKRVLNGAGQLVAGADAFRLTGLQSVVDKWRYVAVLEALARAHPQELLMGASADAGSARAAPLPQVSGTEQYFFIPHVPPQRQVLLFDIGPAGDVCYLHTHQIGSDEASGAMFMAGANITPPLGAEHIVVVTAADPQRMQALGTWLQETTETRGPVDTQGEILRQLALLRDVHIGVLPTYSCATAAECSR